MRNRFIKIMNALIDLFVVLCIVLVGTYSVYALWDDNRIYADAGNVQDDMLKLKPDADDPSFEELMAINSDVCAWVTLDNTNIDYPILQGETNLTYINTDVYGDFALSGSIYLDCRNNKDFTDSYNVLYGHHMDQSKMFGDLDLYKDETFFNENTTGTLILPDRTYSLKIFAVLVVSASDDNIYEPDRWNNDISGLMNYAKSNSLYVRDIEASQVLAFTTCSSDFTDARTILLAAMELNQAAE